MSHVVERRTREIGVRMALGASPQRVRRMVVRRGLALVVFGIGLGLVAATTLTRFLQDLLFEIDPHDPMTFGVVVLVLIGVSTVASYVPARRASAVDPMTTLRSD
ncbi:MAG: FtsX-like permease family protein [Longimicrobiales bacterium]